MHHNIGLEILCVDDGIKFMLGRTVLLTRIRYVYVHKSYSLSTFLNDNFFRKPSYFKLFFFLYLFISLLLKNRNLRNSEFKKKVKI